MRAIHSRTAVMVFCEVYPFYNSGDGVLWDLSVPEEGGRAFCEMYSSQNRGVRHVRFIHSRAGRRGWRFCPIHFGDRKLARKSRGPRNVKISYVSVLLVSGLRLRSSS